MRKVTLTLFALLSLMVLMVPLAYAPEPPEECPTSLEIWLVIDSISTEPWNGGISVDIVARVFIMNVGEHVAHIGEVSITQEYKIKQEPWNWIMKSTQWKPDYYIDPGQTEEVLFHFTWAVYGTHPVIDANAFRLVAEVELYNHPTGLRIFHYRQSFNLPAM